MSWTITPEQHAAFADLSGDYNPLHHDPQVARRLPFGRVAVHGMHLVVHELERADVNPTALHGTFRNPVGPGEPLESVVDDGRIQVSSHTRAILDLTVTGGLATVPARAVEPPPFGWNVRPEPRQLGDLAEGRRDSIPVWGDAEAITAAFPRLVTRIGARGVAELLAVTRLVGMHVPGLHSMFSSFDLRRHHEPDDDGLGFTVTRIDERFGLVTIDVGSAVWGGRLKAFVRPAPVDVSADTSAVSPDEFADERWLVVGGSRGLGAAAAQLLRAGGADARITYHQGLVHGAWQVDAAAPLTGLAAVTADGWSPTHLGWFASPPIFSDTSFDRFAAVYVDGFTTAVEQLADGLSGALWPSSEAVDGEVPGLADYAAAKRLGERCCAELAERFGLRIVAPRWPRLLTDQSTSFVPVEFGDITAEVLTALRALSGT